ncbi:glycine--tRNA ligase [Goodfellowiella coeruleoviolacea]|uniref:Multifunctional fusion protein n=1 Tax=Goodfellowiella coeruleoviolacea TaxID=334858 RepID=A0AAE3KE59_9PSEU|nr:glycine--tRNA ligase [Goodfellowiella coeruleoviolacea]MCP2164946.1 glycyl-tRNA synthetase beta chain [Goodfellowiella coeruleoviolacea]
MQDALLALTRYWTDRGCLVVQPFNTEVGAGTLNPATVLRVLGPEPWRVAYVEPSVRPDDARYGENPNRLQTHTQFQVILKPDPGNPQELYLGSLAALGIDVRAHDVRFVEDNWASPALGAWGLGWEVWLDGLEITQFTYFQQAGGLTLDPVSVEITYGVERIMMALQQVDHFKKIAYAPGISYGEAFGQAEYEMSRYYLDDADVAANQRLFEDYAAEARRMLDAGLPVPAHTLVLKCSHTFNVLDARGAISTTERARAFGRMRELAREVAALWAQRREELGHPLGTVSAPPAAALPERLPEVTAPATLLFEIGTEELPPAEVSRTVTAVREAVTAKLAASRLAHGEVTVHGTPRRIVVLVAEVAPREPDAERTVRGPRASAAYDAEGQPTRAALGFARGQGVDVGELTRIDVDGVEYVGLVRTDVGRGAVEVLSGLLAEVVGELRADKNMRWNDAKLSFSRPIRWLLALLGDTPVPVVVSSLASGTTTRVHRTAEAPEIEVSTADGYLDLLARHEIDADAAHRRQQIVAGAGMLAAQVGGTVDAEAEAALVDEVTNLVEWPTPVLGGFAPDYLELPAEILTTVMRKHQRYLPVRDAQGALLPHFVAVANGACDEDVVRAGNEAVLRARYEDAAFFWRADLATPLARMKAGLTKLTFAERLGSMADRAERIAELASVLADRVELTETDRATLTRAGELAKFDLGSQMVIELSSLAGVMAREYARRAGEPEAVATALFEMELPRGGGDALPTTTPGALLALADRFDLLVGLFGIGANPTGRSDPFGLRRAALGVVSILRAFPGLRAITLDAALSSAAARLADRGVDVPANALATAREFIVRRYEQQLLDAGHDHRFVNAVLPLADAPADADQAVAELTDLAGDAEFAELVAALQRVRRIVPASTLADYDPAVLAEPAEQALHRAFAEVRDALGGRRVGLAEFVAAARPLVVPVNEFFDQVLVMAEDETVRAARLGLLASVRDLAAGILDWPALGTSLTG